jgi:hypothetical protein
MRYRAGCRCSACRGANTAYETARAKARKGGDWNGFVSAIKAKAHILALAEQGVGRRQVSDASGVADSIVHSIRLGTRMTIRARTERLILAVTAAAIADRALIDAGPSWKLLDDLLATGYSKASLARALGYSGRWLQLNRNQCTARNAYNVAQLHQKLQRVPAEPTQRLIVELREEGYNPARINKLLAELAARKGVAAPDLKVYRTRFMSAASAQLVQQLHAQLTGEPE